MKAVYEIVRITDIKPGDVVKVSNLDEYPIFKVSEVRTNGKGAFCYEIKPEFGYSVDRMYFSDEGCIYRQLPPERNPDVLMRVIESMHSEICAWNELGDYPSPTDAVNEYIDKAIRELEGEAGR